MNRKINSIINNRSFFKISYFIFLSINMIQYFNITILSRILLALFLFWGLYMVVREIFIKKGRNYFYKKMNLLVCFLILCAIFYTYNWNNQGFYNLIALFCFSLCILVMYINDFKLDSGLKEMLAIAKIYSILSIIVSNICIYMYLAQIHITILGRNGSHIPIGIWENRLFGVFSSPNVGGTFFSIGIFLSLFLLFSLKYGHKVIKKWKYVCYLNVFMSAWYIVLSLSRGTYVSFIIAFFTCFILYKIPRDRKHAFGSRFIKKISIIIFIITITGVFSISIRLFSQFIISNRTEQVISFERIEYGNKSINVKKDDNYLPEEKPKDISNKRFSIWKASIKLALKTPLTGIGNSYYKLQNMKLEELVFLTNDEQNMIRYSAGNIHNGYFQIFVCCGGLVMVIYMLFLFLSFLKILYFFPKIEDVYIRNSCVFSIAIVIYLLVNNLFESNMALMGANSFQAAMWTFLGYVVLICNIKGKGVLL